MKTIALDSFDYAILDVVQADNRLALKAIAERVNLSTAAVQRRMRRLEDEGVIAKNIAVIDPNHVGQPITIIVEVTLERTHISELDAMRKRLSVPEVQQCYYVTGDVDFVLVVTVATMDAYEALARKLFYENTNVKMFRSLVALDRVKVGLGVDLSRVKST